MIFQNEYKAIKRKEAFEEHQETDLSFALLLFNKKRNQMLLFFYRFILILKYPLVFFPIGTHDSFLAMVEWQNFWQSFTKL